MKQWIKTWLGITEIHKDLEMVLHIQNLDTDNVLKTINVVSMQIGIHNRALGRVIAKLDPLFVTDEMDPNRKAESDRLGQEAIKRIIGEYKSSNQ